MPAAPRRHDHTAWVTHFVRDRKPEQDFPGEDEDECGTYAGGELEWDADAFTILKTIIRLGGLTPGYSFRKGRTTIYGGQPALCATEMPLYAFATYARKRADTSKVSAYGISFLKSEFYQAGGRPAIYGLSTGAVRNKRSTATCRIMNEDILPRREQYRFVAHNPGGAQTPIDWSHEREWRWIPTDAERDQVWAINHQDIYGPIPALPLFKGANEGHAFSKVCIIVWTKEEATEIQALLTSLYLAGANNYDTPFDRGVIKRSAIIVLQDVIAAVETNGDIDAQTIEGLAAAQLLKPIAIALPPPDAAQIVAAAFAAAGKAGKKAGATYKAAGHPHSGFGFAHAATTDVTSPIVQYMLTEKLASGPYDGVVWIKYPGPLGSGDISYNEAVCEAAVKKLSGGLGIKVYVATADD